MTRRLDVLTGSLVILSALAAPAQAQTVDTIVARHYESRGGLDTWNTIRTERLTGTISAAGLEMSMVFIATRTGLGRQELSMEIPGVGPVTVINVFDGKQAWTINPMLGGNTPQPLTGQEADAIRDQSDMDGPLIGYKAKGHVVELIGTETVNGRDTHHLKITRQNRPTLHYYLDVETGSELRVVSESAGSSSVDLLDFRPVDGVLVPHHTRVFQNGQLQAEAWITSVEFNVPVDDGLFRPR